MKRTTIAALSLFLLAGCVSVSPDVQALRYAQALQSPDAPASKEIVIDGTRWTVAKMGIALLEPDSRVAFVSLAVTHARTGRWPDVSELHVQNGNWTVRQAGDYLLLTAQEGVKGSIREALLTPDAYLSVDEKLLPFLVELEAIFRDGRSGRLPVIPISTP
jgi:hypothetical protein